MDDRWPATADDDFRASVSPPFGSRPRRPPAGTNDDDDGSTSSSSSSDDDMQPFTTRRHHPPDTSNPFSSPSRRPPPSRSQSPANSGPLPPLLRTTMTLPTFGLGEFFKSTGSGSGTSSSDELADRGRSHSTGGSARGEKCPSSFFSSYSPMSLAASISLPSRPLSPPPTYPTFHPNQTDSPTRKGRNSSRTSTILTRSSSFVSALSRPTSDLDTDESGDDDDRAGSGRLGEGERRDSESSGETLGDSQSQPPALKVSFQGERGESTPTGQTADEPQPSRSMLSPQTNGQLKPPPPLQSRRSASEGSYSSGTGSTWSAQKKPSLLRRVMGGFSPASSGSSQHSGAGDRSPSQPSFDPTSPVSPECPKPPKRTSSFASSFLTSPLRSSHNSRKYVRVHSKGVSQKERGLNKLFLAQTIDTTPEAAPANGLKPILTGIPLSEEPSNLSQDATPAASTSTSTSASPSTSSRRSFSIRGSSPSPSRTPISPSSSRLGNVTPSSRPPVSIRTDVPSRSNSTKKRSSGAKKDSGKPLWCLEWSYDGRYLATAGQDGIVRLYQVRSAESPSTVSSPCPGSSSLQENVLEPEPCQVWLGHTDGVLTLCWSKNGFLASGSMDKTARLWHPTRTNCLTIFQHPDYVTSLAFHPKDDRFFLTGCCDSKVRIWSIIEKRVRAEADLPEMVTAVAFSVEGSVCAAGTFSGKVHFFSDHLKPQSQLKVRSTRGKNSKGKKITHLQFVSASKSVKSVADERLLVTSNDSRVRLYRLVDMAVELKFKGHQNDTSQIAATFSDDGRWIICGSEDGNCFLWSTDWPRDGNEGSRHLQFQADDTLVSCASLAPLNTRLLLAAAGDPIYKLPRGEIPVSRPGSPVSSADTLSPVLRSIGLISPTSETSLELARTLSRTLSRATLGNAELEALLDTPLIAVATMRGTVKIFRGDPGLPPPVNGPSLRSPASKDSLGFSRTRRGSMGSFMRRQPSQGSSQA